MITEGQSTGFRRLIIAFCVVGGLLLAIVVAAVLVVWHFGTANIHAFISPGNSMCPTLCQNERFFADLNAYSTNVPARGDVILFNYVSDSQNTLFAKRVIGVAGDTISTDKNGKIFVNGQPLSLPSEKSVCGTPASGTEPISEPPLFPATTIQPGFLFLVGDNVGDSFDSRYPNFGAAPAAQARGKLVMIYWSPGSGRIFCPIR